MIGVVDYGAGNLRSVANALDRIDQAYRVCESPVDLTSVDMILLPGVGQFAAAMRHLRATGLDDAIRDWGERGKPIIGICLGLHLLFESSAEDAAEPGLGLIAGRVIRLQTSTVPHMGWNRLSVNSEARWLTAADDAHVYFAHSYVAQPADSNIVCASASVDESTVIAAIQRDATRAVQFHPEKSASAGAEILKAMVSC